MKKFGKVVLLRVIAKKSTAVAEGSDLFVGNLDKYRPPFDVMGSSCYSGSRIISGLLSSDGTVTLRVSKGTTVANTNYYVNFIYIVD